MKLVIGELDIDRDRRKSFNEAQEEVQRLDGQGRRETDIDMYRQYQRRNSFGLDPNMKIYRIFQKAFYDADVQDKVLTLPRASSTFWVDDLEIPLSSVKEVNVNQTFKQKETYHWGDLVSNYFSLCWTRRANPNDADWAYFSHGKPAIRIETTVGKLLDRVMSRSDSFYMNKSWLIDVEYKDQEFIRQMKNPEEVQARIEASGSELALSAAIVRADHSGEDEIRYLFDNGIEQSFPVIKVGNVDLIRLPFDWEGFVDNYILCP